MANKLIRGYLVACIGLVIVFICFVITNAHASRNCQVSIFPVVIHEGNQCRFDEVAVGFDHVEGKIACGRISVNCN